MKFFMALLCGFVAVSAAPTDPAAIVAARRRLPALDHEEIRDEWGQFALRYVTAEGTVVSERGRLVPTPDGSDYVMIIEGQVRYIGDDGKVYITKYTAGLDGTHVEGNHLPVSVTAEPIIAPSPVAVVAEPVKVVTPVVVAEPSHVVAKPFNVIGHAQPLKVAATPH